MATKPWKDVIATAIEMYKSNKYRYFYGAKGQVLTDYVMNELIRQEPGHFAKYSAKEIEQIKNNARGYIGTDCSYVTGHATGDEQWSKGQISNCSKYNTLQAGPTASLLFTTWGGTGRHIGLDIGNGYCLQAGYEPTDAIMKQGKGGIWLSPISETAWEQSGMSKAVNYTGVYSPYEPTTKLVEEVYGRKPLTTPLWVGEATTLVNVRTSPEVINYSNGNPKNALTAWPRLGDGNLVNVCDTTFAPGWYYILIAGKYYGWVKSDYIVKAGSRPLKVGDKIRFVGSKLYASSYPNGKAVAVPGFHGTIKGTNMTQSHPYLLKSNGVGEYEGWANAADVLRV